MKRLASPALMAVALICCSTATASSVRPRAAVARVGVAEGAGVISFGSGTLVAKDGQQGWVLTNWHVIRDARGPVTVFFPDGFRSEAKVVAVDRRWDLAVLAIGSPPVEPLPLATHDPQLGESLLIAGYGQEGEYREVTGRCLQYVAPDVQSAQEMLEMTGSARQGDSGGPILNRQGQVAGILFGTAGGRTTGTNSGRISRFLDGLIAPSGDNPLPETPLLLAERPVSPWTQYPPMEERLEDSSWLPDPAQVARLDGPGSMPLGRMQMAPVAPSVGYPAAVIVPSEPPPPLAPTRPEDSPVAVADATGEIVEPAEPIPSLFDQAKNVMALVGVFFIFFRSMRLLISQEETARKKTTRRRRRYW